MQAFLRDLQGGAATTNMTAASAVSASENAANGKLDQNAIVERYALQHASWDATKISRQSDVQLSARAVANLLHKLGL